MTARACFVAYDVADDSRRRRVADLLADAGGARVQRSAFWVPTGGASLALVAALLVPVIAADVDAVALYRTCGNCPGIVGRTRAAALPPDHDPNRPWII